jgi:hypothetical protein
MTTKPGTGNNATACKFGRMTLPAYGLTQAKWIHIHRRWHHHEKKGLRMASAPAVHTVVSIFVVHATTPNRSRCSRVVASRR